MISLKKIFEIFNRAITNLNKRTKKLLIGVAHLAIYTNRTASRRRHSQHTDSTRTSIANHQHIHHLLIDAIGDLVCILKDDLLHSYRQPTWALWTIRSLCQSLHNTLQLDHSAVQLKGTTPLPREFKVTLKELIAHSLHLVTTHSTLTLLIRGCKASGCRHRVRAIGANVPNLTAPATPPTLAHVVHLCYNRLFEVHRGGQSHRAGGRRHRLHPHLALAA